MLIGFIVWLFYVRLCAKLGAKRVIGGVNGVFYGIFFSYLGILFILSSRKLLDDKANAALLALYKPVNSTHPEV